MVTGLGMSLKQLLFADDAIKQLPAIVQLMQSGSLPDNELNDIFSSLSKLIYGSFCQRKIGLSVLRYCLINLYRTNRIGENIDLVLKWWKAVVNCMKSRYSPDCTYRLACCNAIILSQISASYIDLLIEGRANVPAMVMVCTSHVCSESFDLLLIITQQYASHVGKQVDEIKAFCLSHVHDEFCEISASIFAHLSCVGPAGKQSSNYTRAWGQSCSNSIESLKNLLCSVVGMETTSLQYPVLPAWQFSSSLTDAEKANREITFLSQCIKSLLQMPLEVSVSFPLASIRTFLQAVHTAFNESQVYNTNINENFTKALVINHVVSEVLSFLDVLVSKLQTTSFLIQPQIEDMLISFLQKSFQLKAVVKLLETMVNTGCAIIAIPFVMLIDLLSVKSLQIKGPVTKKQKTEQFSTFTFETSTLGAHDEYVMISVLALLDQVLKDHGTSLPQLKTQILRTRCQEIISHKESFSHQLILNTYKTLNTLSSQTFEYDSVLSLSSSLKCAKSLTFANNEIHSIEPHLHPERHSFRPSVASNGIPLTDENSRNRSSANSTDRTISFSTSTHLNQMDSDSSWQKEHEALFEKLPYSIQSSTMGPEVNNNDIEMCDGNNSSGSEYEESTGNQNVSIETSETSNDGLDNIATTGSHVQKETADYEYDIIVPPKMSDCSFKEPENVVVSSKLSLLEDESEQLKDILSAFVDEPASGDES